MRGHIKSVGFIIPNEIGYQQNLARFTLSAPLFFSYFLEMCASKIFQLEDPPTVDFDYLILIWDLQIRYIALLLIMAISLSNCYEIFRWTDPISGNEFENICKWIKSFDQDVQIMKSNLENVEMLEFD
jgi:hypothetical protein